LELIYNSMSSICACPSRYHILNQPGKCSLLAGETDIPDTIVHDPLTLASLPCKEVGTLMLLGVAGVDGD
jgi:hypothetical protein